MLMSIKVLFFASLRERLGRGDVQLDASSPLSIAEVWQQASGEICLPANVLVSINQTYADATAQVQPGDEVAFFPPVTGG